MQKLHLKNTLGGNMKNIEQILQEVGVELTDEQKKTLNKEVDENYKTISDYEKQKQKLSAAESNAKDNESALSNLKKELEKLDVKDIDGLKAKLSEYETSLSTQKDEYEKKIKKLELNSILKKKADELSCKDFDLAISQLNVDELLESKDQSADIEKAFNSLKENKPILFGDDEPKPIGRENIIKSVGNTGGKGMTKEKFNKLTYRERVELKQKDEKLYNLMTEKED